MMLGMGDSSSNAEGARAFYLKKNRENQARFCQNMSLEQHDREQKRLDSIQKNETKGKHRIWFKNEGNQSDTCWSNLSDKARAKRNDYMHCHSSEKRAMAMGTIANPLHLLRRKRDWTWQRILPPHCFLSKEVPLASSSLNGGQAAIDTPLWSHLSPGFLPVIKTSVIFHHGCCCFVLSIAIK